MIVEGCQQPDACNYNPDANDPNTADDCTGTVACVLTGMANYNEEAAMMLTENPLSEFYCLSNVIYAENDICEQWLGGCTSVTACNYNESANYDDGSCEEPPVNYDCFGFCLNDADTDGICDELEVAGCQDDTACNYNELATDSDDSCIYVDGVCDTCSGETDGTGTIVDNDADDDGVCDLDETAGCMDDTACNYNPDATNDDGSCDGTVACTDPSMANFIGFDIIADCNSNLMYADNEICEEWFGGCMEEDACNYNESANYDDGSCAYPGCTNPIACNYDATAGCDDGSCEMPGCDILQSANYNPDAICIDNTTCIDIVYGCIDPTACNYDSLANTENGSCEYPTNAVGLNVGCEECNDSNEAVLIDVNDNGICDSEELGCMDEDACNYNVMAEFDDGSCIIPSTVWNESEGMDIICEECCKFESGSWMLSNYPGSESTISGMGGNWGISSVMLSEETEYMDGGMLVYKAVFEGTQVTSACYNGEATVSVYYSTSEDVDTLGNVGPAGTIYFTISGDGVNMSSIATITTYNLNDGVIEGVVSGGNAGSVIALETDSDLDGIIDCEDEYPHIGLTENTLGFNIYPNPADDVFTVEMPFEHQKVTISIVNTLGQVVESRSGISNLTFNVNNYSPGLYQVNIRTENELINQSLIIR